MNDCGAALDRVRRKKETLKQVAITLGIVCLAVTIMIVLASFVAGSAWAEMVVFGTGAITVGCCLGFALCWLYGFAKDALIVRRCRKPIPERNNDGTD